MISVNNSIFFKPTFKGSYGQKSLTSNAVCSDKYYDACIVQGNYGRALVKTPMEECLELQKKLDNTSDTDTISVDDAAKEFSTLKYTDKRKTDMILACAFENNKPDVVINKKALLILKSNLIDGGAVPKIEDVVRTCLDESTGTFNSRKFDSMFNPNGKVKLSARLKPRPQNLPRDLKDAKMQKRLLISNAVEKYSLGESKEASFNNSDFFVPIQSQRDSLIADLDSMEDVPQDLKNSIIKSLYQNNFNIKKVYTDYYALLNDCETLEDVKEFYPELKYPEEKPVAEQGGSSVSLRNRLANEDYDKVIIGILKRGYVDLKSKNDLYIPLETSRPTTYLALQKAGYHISMPSKEMLALMNKADGLAAKYSNVPDLKDEDIKSIANKQAIKTSNVWGDYSEMTRTTWLPIRLIKNKRMKPQDSEYKTQNMVNAYLYNLYKFNKNADYPANPLEQFDDKNYLNKQMFGVVNGAYWTRYKKEDVNLDIDFILFQSKFDKQAIGKSFEHLENNYTKSFFSKYWTPERVENLKQGMQNAYDMVYEKILLKEQLTPKVVTDKDVQELIEDDLAMEIVPVVDSDEYAEMKYITSSIKNQDLKERCMACVSGETSVDSGYFGSIYKIIQNSQSVDGLDEDKALVLINLHDQYMNKIMNNPESQVEEDVFVSTYLEKYKLDDGDYDYSQAMKDSKAESKYFNLASKLQARGEEELNTLIEDKFILQHKPDYHSANTIIGYYEDIPDTFRGKFVNEFKERTKVDSKILLEDLTALHDKISSWNFDKDDEIIMDADKIPQKVVITHNAKNDLWNITGQNMKVFDSYLTKFQFNAQTRTGKKGGTGIKTVTDKPYPVELKILGDGGYWRMYPRPITEADIFKYDKGDGIHLKYIFDKCDDHS